MYSSFNQSAFTPKKSGKLSPKFWILLSTGIFFILCLVAYLLIPVFAKSYIRNKMNKAATEHNWTISMDKMKISHYRIGKGLTCSFDEMLISKKETKDSVIYVSHASANVAVKLKKGFHANVKNIESDYAYLSLATPKDTTQKDKPSEKDYPKTLNKVMQLFTDFFPKQLSSQRIELKTMVYGTPVFYRIDSLMVSDENLTGTCAQIAGDTIIRWQISGTIRPDEENYVGHITLKDNPNDDKVRILSEKFKTQFLCDDLSFGLQKTNSNKGQLNFTFKGHCKNAHVDNVKISEKEILIEDAAFNFNVQVSDNSITIDSTSTAMLNGLTIHPFIKYEKNKKSHIIFSVKEKGINAHTFFGALPTELFTVASKLDINGTMDFSMIFDCDFASIDSLKFDFSIKGHGLSFSEETRALFGRFAGSFAYPCFVGDSLTRNIIIGPENPAFCSFERIPKFLKYAILASEDASFFAHRGFIKTSIRDAMVTNMKRHRFVRGGSTISMQLVKNLFLNRKKQFSRKLEELLLVWLIEDNRLLSKDRMFEIYVNIAEWAPCINGIIEASNFYFDKQPEQLTFGECIYLATLIRAPKLYAYTLNEAGEVTEARRSEMRFVANRMLDREMITADEHALFNSFVATHVTDEKKAIARQAYSHPSDCRLAE